MQRIITPKLFNKQKTFSKDKSGKFTVSGLPNAWNKNYAQSVVKYLNCLEPLFEKAQKKTDFQFIFTLLGFRGVESPGQDPYQNSLETIDSLMDIEKKIKGRAKLNIFLWVYAHIIESSGPYEIIANLLNICVGKTYRTFNFPYKKSKYGYRPQSPNEKINYLENLAAEVKMSFALDPIKEIFDKELRNAVFHSDYSVYRGEVLINHPTKIYPAGEALALVNKALAYHETVKNLIQTYVKSYDEPKIIEVSPEFSSDPEERAQIIVRKNHGVIGLKAAWTEEQVRVGKIAWFVGNIFSYEHKLINNGQYLLPKSREDFWNNILKRMPNFLYKRMLDPIEKYIVNR